MKHIVAIIPCLNEADSILAVIASLKKSGVTQIIVALDALTDDNSEVLLKKAHIHFVRGKVTGYDGTVEEGIKNIRTVYPSAEYVLFSDAGGKYAYDVVKEFIKEMNNGADLVLGVRTNSRQHMLWHQKLGTQLVLLPINMFFHKAIQDISPFRLVRYDMLTKLRMQSKKFSYPSQMLIKALAIRANVVQVPVVSLKRSGTSKVSGSIKNSLLAGLNMLESLQYARFK